MAGCEYDGSAGRRDGTAALHSKEKMPRGERSKAVEATASASKCSEAAACEFDLLLTSKPKPSASRPSGCVSGGETTLPPNPSDSKNMPRFGQT